MRSTILLHSLLMLVILLLIKSDNFASQAFEQFCDSNRVDAVIWNGKMYRLTRGELVANFDHSNRYGSVGQFRQSDILHRPEHEIHYQSMFYIHGTKVDHCHLNSTPECFAMRSLRYSVISFVHDNNTGNQYLNQTYHYSTHYTRHHSGVSVQYLCDDTYDDANNDTLLYPKYIGCKSQTYKPATYAIDKHLLIFIFNARFINTTKAVLATRTLTYDQWSDGWKYADIENSENMLYLTAFYWHFTNNVYIVAENTSEPSSGGFIYQFNETDLQNPLIPTNQRVIDFFGCDGSVLGFRKRPITLGSTSKSATVTSEADTAGIIAVSILSALILIGIILLIAVLILNFMNYKRNKANVSDGGSQTNKSNTIEESDNVSTQSEAEVSATNTNVENERQTGIDAK